MAGNEWINGYLEAILDSGAAAGGGGGGPAGGAGAGDPRSPVAGGVMSPTGAASPRGPHMNFNPTHYFVEEVVKGVDESDLHRTWIKVVATRNARERSTRLENMCWRIWHLARKKKQVYTHSFQIAISPCSFSCFSSLNFVSVSVISICFLFATAASFLLAYFRSPVGFWPYGTVRVFSLAECSCFPGRETCVSAVSLHAPSTQINYLRQISNICQSTFVYY